VLAKHARFPSACSRSFRTCQLLRPRRAFRKVGLCVPLPTSGCLWTIRNDPEPWALAVAPLRLGLAGGVPYLTPQLTVMHTPLSKRLMNHEYGSLPPNNKRDASRLPCCRYSSETALCWICVNYLPVAVTRTRFDLYASTGKFIDIGIPEEYDRAQTELAGLISMSERSIS